MKISKGRIVFLIGVLFLLTFIVDGFFLFSSKVAIGDVRQAELISSANSEQESLSQTESEFIIDGKEVIRIKTPGIGSPLRNSSASLGGEAAAVTNKTIASCQTLPVEVWIFLLLVFLGLLIFNLTYDFTRTKKIRWGWESFYLLLTLLAWFKFDGCREVIWFPLYALKLGLLVYIAYLFFFQNKSTEEEENQESLF